MLKSNGWLKMPEGTPKNNGLLQRNARLTGLRLRRQKQRHSRRRWRRRRRRVRRRTKSAGLLQRRKCRPGWRLQSLKMRIGWQKQQCRRQRLPTPRRPVQPKTSVFERPNKRRNGRQRLTWRLNGCGKSNALRRRSVKQPGWLLPTWKKRIAWQPLQKRKRSLLPTKKRGWLPRTGKQPGCLQSGSRKRTGVRPALPEPCRRRQMRTLA